MQDFDLLSLGYDEQKQHKKITYFRILKYTCPKSILQGPHEILIFPNLGNVESGYTFWVYSLTRLRNVFFQMEDRLSFERSTFLIDRKHHRLIRLKNIRDKISLPQIQSTSISEISLFVLPNKSIRCILSEFVKKKEEEKNRQQFSPLAQNQITRQMEVLWILYTRQQNKLHFMQKDDMKCSIVEQLKLFLTSV